MDIPVEPLVLVHLLVKEILYLQFLDDLICVGVVWDNVTRWRLQYNNELVYNISGFLYLECVTQLTGLKKVNNSILYVKSSLVLLQL